MFWLKLQCIFVVISYGVSFTPLRNHTKNLINHNNRSSGVEPNVICGLCNFAVGHLISKRRDFKYDDKMMEVSITTICVLVTKFLNYQGICKGLVEINLNTILYIIDNSDADGEYACSILLQNQNCPTRKKIVPWSVEIPEMPKKVETKIKPKSSAQHFRVLHITDIHYDPHYLANKSLPCKRPLCCQDDDEDDNFITNGKNRAGYWTDYSYCDVPFYFIDETFTFIKENIELDYIYFTGDIISHRIWDTSVSSNKRDIAFLMKLFKQRFGNITVLPVLGNHEPHPLNLYVPYSNNTQLSTTWLFDHVADLWSDWLPSTALETVRKGGYYTLKLKNGLRIISLNNNVAYTLNYWLIYKDEDYYDQLQWLIDTLKKAEESGEKVHILAHMPFGDQDTYIPWSTQFKRIIIRFSRIISGVFYGHTHTSEINVFLGDDFKRPVNIGFNGGSITPYSNVNPNFNILSVDSDNFEIQDIDVWVLNLAEANKKITTNLPWKISYSFRNEYGLADLAPNTIFDLFKKMVLDKTLRHTYFRNKIRRSKYFLAMGCDNKCHQENLCNIITTVYSEHKKCSQYIPENLS